MNRIKAAWAGIAALFSPDLMAPIKRYTGRTRRKIRNRPSINDQFHADRSKRVMRSERGNQKQHVKARMFYRNALRQGKKLTSYCNNINPYNGRVICN